MHHQGHLQKMITSLAAPVEYSLPLDEEQLPLNDKLGKIITLEYQQAIHCIACGRKTNKSFNQGYCYPCMKSLAQCDICIVKPELCHYDQGTCREPDWALDHCMQDHFVYLANSSGLKVGITRGSQIPTRWMDQGASQALPIFRVKNRHIAGLLEVAFKEHVADRTDWRKMLKGEAEPLDLAAERDRLHGLCTQAVDELSQQFGETAVQFQPDSTVTDISYPVLEYPSKVSSFNFDKTSQISGSLMGIKGQYLILDSGVLNIRKFGGYQISVTFA